MQPSGPPTKASEDRRKAAAAPSGRPGTTVAPGQGGRTTNPHRRLGAHGPMERACEKCGTRIPDDGSGVPLCRECLSALGLEISMHDYLTAVPSPEGESHSGLDLIQP